jgi:hypothetical protein
MSWPVASWSWAWSGWRARFVLFALVTFVLLVAAVLTSPRAAAAEQSAQTVKYYVVQPEVDGAPEYLFEIAVRTLGNGNKANDIFMLNVGRPQPDGGRLEDPSVLHAGWILLLPPEAKGSAVLSGPLPSVAPAGGNPPPVSAPPLTVTIAGTDGSTQPDSDRALLRLVLAGIAAIATLYLLVLLIGARRGGAGDGPSEATEPPPPPARRRPPSDEMGLPPARRSLTPIDEPPFPSRRAAVGETTMLTAGRRPTDALSTDDRAEPASRRDLAVESATDSIRAAAFGPPSVATRNQSRGAGPARDHAPEPAPERTVDTAYRDGNRRGAAIEPTWSTRAVAAPPRSPRDDAGRGIPHDDPREPGRRDAYEPSRNTGVESLREDPHRMPPGSADGTGPGSMRPNDRPTAPPVPPLPPMAPRGPMPSRAATAPSGIPREAPLAVALPTEVPEWLTMDMPVVPPHPPLGLPPASPTMTAASASAGDFESLAPPRSAPVSYTPTPPRHAPEPNPTATRPTPPIVTLPSRLRDISAMPPLAGPATTQPATVEARSTRPPEDTPYLRAEVRLGEDRVAVRLDAGQVTDVTGTPAYRWDTSPTWPGMPLAVCVGRDGDRQLSLDLGRCREIVQIAGTAQARRQVALAIAEQFRDRPVEVTFVGEGLGVAPPYRGAGEATAMSTDGTAARTPAPRCPLVVFITAARPADVEVLRNLADASKRRLIQIFLGDDIADAEGPTASWRLTCTTPEPPAVEEIPVAQAAPLAKPAAHSPLRPVRRRTV